MEVVVEAIVKWYEGEENWKSGGRSGFIWRGELER